MANPSEAQVRYVIVRGVRYLHAEDVAALIREVGTTEETDVRNRLNELAERVSGVPKMV